MLAALGISPGDAGRGREELGMHLITGPPPDAGVVHPLSMKFCLRGDDL